MNNFSKKNIWLIFVDTVNKNKNNSGTRIISWNSTDYIAPSRVTLTNFYHNSACRQKVTNPNWRAPWKNRISSTFMKLRKSHVKPVKQQNISSSVLSPEIVMHDAFNVILWTSADICVVMHDDLGWKNWTTPYILPRHWLYEWFSSAASVRRYMLRAWRSLVKEPNNMLNRFWRAGCSRLEYVDIRLVC